MGAGELRDSFNSVSQPSATCTIALLDYERAHGIEFQILWFRGITSDGSTFDIKSDPLRPGSNLNDAAKAAAAQLLKQGNTPP